MYGFISGAVNNDVGRQRGRGRAGAAADPDAASRRRVLVGAGFAHGGAAGRAADRQGHRLLALSGRRRRAARGRSGATTGASTLAGLAALAVGALAVHELSGASRRRVSLDRRRRRDSRGSAARRRAPQALRSRTRSAIVGYLWQVFLPRLSFMAPHFETASAPAFVIFVERGWGAFGWYDVFFPHWVYEVDLCGDARSCPCWRSSAARREWRFVRRNLVEAGAAGPDADRRGGGLRGRLLHDRRATVASPNSDATRSPRSPRSRCSSWPSLHALRPSLGARSRAPACSWRCSP